MEKTLQQNVGLLSTARSGGVPLRSIARPVRNKSLENCDGDGYSGNVKPVALKRTPFTLPLLVLPADAAGRSAAQQLFVNAVSDADTNSETRKGSLQSITEGARRMNADARSSSLEAIVAPGVYVLSQAALFRNNKACTATNRLVIRAGALLDDPRWHPQQMPTVLTDVPLEVDAGVETGNGIQIEINHVTIQGLRFTGGLDFYYKTPNQMLRAYPNLA